MFVSENPHIQSSIAPTSIAPITTAPRWYQRHAMNVAMLAYAFAEQSRIVPSTQAYEAGFFHDLGKTVLPAHLWNKPFPCTPHEVHKIRMHPILGRIIGQHLGLPAYILECIELHHERVDGGGYPYGKTDIPLLVQVISVVDTYVAMGEPRTYHIPKRGELAIEEMERVRGSQLDAQITDRFIAFLRSADARANDQDRQHVLEILEGHDASDEFGGDRMYERHS